MTLSIRTESDGCDSAELEKGKMGERFQTLSEDAAIAYY